MATAAAESELKQQGAFEAARDPNSSVTAADAQAKAEAESKKAGAAVFSFDPDATPEQKAAQARAVRTTDSASFPKAIANFSLQFSAYQKAFTKSIHQRVLLL